LMWTKRLKAATTTLSRRLNLSWGIAPSKYPKMMAARVSMEVEMKAVRICRRD
jgi:hypothetical protein